MPMLLAGDPPKLCLWRTQQFSLALAASRQCGAANMAAPQPIVVKEFINVRPPCGRLSVSALRLRNH